MASALATLMNHAMQIEREQVLKAESHQRTGDRQGYANGFKPKTLKPRVGPVDLRIPQTRGYRDENGRPFYPRSLEWGVRSERAMTLAVAEMYVQGVSTRKLTAIVQELCGLDITSTRVSRAAAELDEQLAAWWNRPIGEITYLVLDARYEKVRHGGAIVPCALLTAIGIGPDGKRSVLGCSVQLSEAEPHWRSFLQSLVDRGMRGVKLVVSDDHGGLKAARQAVLTVLRVPTAHRRRLRTTNGLERLNKEIKRRTRVATLFLNEASLLWLASAVLSEISDDWETERAYLNMETR
jgi:transposase-like protein